MHAAIRASDRCHPTPMCVSDPVTRLRPHSQQPRMTPSPVKPQTSMAAYAVEMHVCGRCGVYCASRIAPCVAHAGHAHGLLPAMICVSRRQLLSQVAPHAAAFAQSTRLRGRSSVSGLAQSSQCHALRITARLDRYAGLRVRVWYAVDMHETLPWRDWGSSVEDLDIYL